MNHLVLFFACFISIEIFFRSEFLQYATSIIKISKKVLSILPSKKISDHWKEKAILFYALGMMRSSLIIALTLLCMASIFLIINTILKGFIDFSLSSQGILESILFAFVYIKLRMVVLK